jgi:hypothetical protein
MNCTRDDSEYVNTNRHGATGCYNRILITGSFIIYIILVLNLTWFGNQ